jgi:iron complex outermembrane receptor protein
MLLAVPVSGMDQCGSSPRSKWLASLMSSKTLLSVALTAALAVPFSAVAETLAAGDSKTLDAVQVTGSNIKRSDTETANPVQVISHEQIAESGKLTVSDLLRSISANTGNSSNETTNNGWSSGAAGIGLRGLSTKNTLILLNGRRLANYGFPNGGLSDTFVNLNALPLVAVERIEVLKDGASAVYGSDAVAGVVNIITRQGFEGAELGGSAGRSGEGDMDTHTAKFVGGIGDLENDGYNILVSLEGYNRERLDHHQRDLTASGDFRDFAGGSRSGWSAKGARFLVGGVSVPLLDAAGKCPEGTVLTASAPIDGRAGDTCGYNLNDYSTLIPSTKRWQAYVNGTFKLSDSVEAFGEFLYSDIKGTSWFGSSPYFTLESGRFALNADSGLAEPISALLPASNPYNPYGRDVSLEYTFFNLGATFKTNRSTALRAVGGLRGRGEVWDWEVAAFGASSSERETVSGGFANRWTLADALASGSYNLLDPSATPQSVIDGITLSTLRPADSKLYGVDAKATRTLGELKHGSVGFAAGYEFRREKLDSWNPWQVDAGLQIRPAIAEVHGQRDVHAVYAEVVVPLAPGLEVDVAARGDRYDDFGEAFSPKLGLRWQPLESVLVRASASRGFRAPSLSENSASTMISYSTSGVVDPFDPDQPGARVSPTFFTIGNTDLEPEKTRSFNAGVVFSPAANTSLSVDWYKIKVDNVIGSGNTTTLIERNDPADVLRDANGKLQAVYNRYQNLSELQTSGIDVELRQRWNTDAAGSFGLNSALTYVLDYERPQVIGGPLVDYAGSNLGPSLPDTKATTTLDWSIGDWRTALSWYYTAGYEQQGSTAAKAVQKDVASYSQFDLYLGYSGIDKLNIYAKVQNLGDRQPPFDATFPGIRAPYDFSQYDLRGRYFTLGFDYRF